MEAAWEHWLELRAELEEAGTAFNEAAVLGIQQGHENELVCGEWTLKDVMAHIIGWDREAVSRFEQFLLGAAEDLSYDIDSFNQRWVNEFNSFSRDQVLEELRSGQEQLQQLCSDIDREHILRDARYCEWLEALRDHYRHHTGQLGHEL